MKDPKSLWAAQAAEEQRRLSEADADNPQQRAHWDEDRADTSGDQGTGRFNRVLDRMRRALRR